MISATMENALSGTPQDFATPLLPLGISAIQFSDLRERYTEEFNHLLACFTPEATEATLKTPLSDRRFRGAAWQASALHYMTAAFYLLQARYLQTLAEAVVVDEKLRQRIGFVTTQWVAAMSPANFFNTNPEAQNQLLATCGESLRVGTLNLLADLAKGRISQTAEESFELGKNIACTAGEVVFENELFQLLQYQPLTDKVYARPLLLIPPCINKYYILDLQAENSLVRYALSQGHRVFLISWRNPDPTMIYTTWDDYVEHGAIQAMTVVSEITAQPKINILGFCIGGTLAANALAVLAAREQQVAASLTLLTTLLDFSETGMLGALVDESQLVWREMTIGGLHGGQYGLLRGAELANVFSFLRPDDLVWSYVVENYLKGKTPSPLDMLYWNGDSTNLPGPMYVWYLRNLYLNNHLREAGRLCVAGVPIDLSLIAAPVFVYGSRDDHIVPWRAAYASVQLLSGPCKFVLGAAGHIAGVINSPLKAKRSYWSNTEESAQLPADCESWRQRAQETQGSWWPEWQRWLNGYAGKQVSAPMACGSSAYPPIEPAPGRYVKQKDYFVRESS